VVNNQKLGGILTELSVNSAGFVDYAIVGIGINCCQQTEDFPEELQEIATSLAIATGNRILPVTLASRMLQALCHMDITQKKSVMQRYKADCLTLGQDIVVLRGEEKRYGKAVDLDDDGSLIVAFSDGHTESVSSGEVSVRGLYGYA